MANRVWSYFFGRGIIEPVDDIRASNPPVNPPLLDALTKDFVDHHFDLRHLIRTDGQLAHLSAELPQPTSGTPTTRSIFPTPRRGA